MAGMGEAWDSWGGGRADGGEGVGWCGGRGGGILGRLTSQIE